ncbi:OmpA family protein [Caballeronia sp. LZ062]|uniref:OmpA family protein n=1 Tax=unclassified Caballeronia TaxID=2646786 RepID=UPI002864DBFB|nr:MULTISPECIES: OmpA family protein [unclassified Caballeronia]MDR5856779.1 OmpA family protein [Caballeronia sp. LZ050]MDR5869824.1 OmpA family protein [Caballeronia sp. LZ062]
MSINLVQAVKTAISSEVADQLSQKFGIPAQIVQQLAARTAPGLVASVMDRSALADGARSVYAVIMSPEANAFVAEQLRNVITTTAGLKHLETSGHLLASRATGQRIDALTDAVSAETGVPVQATSALAGMLSAIMFGILKHHFLLSQANLSHLPGLLRDQIGEMRASLTHHAASAIGLGNVDGFVSSIGARLDAVGSTLDIADELALPAATVASHAAPAPTRSTPPVVAPPPPPAPPVPPVSPAPTKSATMRAPVRKPAPKRSNKAVWLLFAVLAAILALVYYRGFTHNPSVDLATSAATTPVSTVAQPASQAAASIDTASTANAVSAPFAATAAPSVEPSAPAAAMKDAQLVFSVSEAGVPSIHATVGSDAEKQQLIQALDHRFGKGYTADVSVAAGTPPAPWLAQLKQLTPLMAVPGAEAKVVGSKVELSGAAADAKLGWAERLKNSLGGMFQVSSFDVDSAVASATQSFRNAMKTLLATDDACSGQKLTAVLDLQVVNFGRSSATVPEGAASTLGETAQLLKNCAAKGSMVNLEIAGYSDGVGAPPAKLEMSKERAQAVRAFLVKSGVPPQSLTATGYGDANPVADNATASGRFANRRIEFVVK